MTPRRLSPVTLFKVAVTDSHFADTVTVAAMSISRSLQASARAAYRDLLRASATTFVGDPPVLNGEHAQTPCAVDSLTLPLSAFKLKMRTEVMPDASLTDATVFEQKVVLAREIADVLRKNIVQARKVADSDSWGASGHFIWL